MPPISPDRQSVKRGSNQGSCRQAGFEPGQSGPGTTQPALDRGGLATFPIYDLRDPGLARFWADSPVNDLRQGAPFDARRRTGPANARSRRKRGATSAKARRRPCSTPPGRGRPRHPWVIYRGIRQRSPIQRDREVIYRESRPEHMRGALRHRPGRRREPSAGERMRAFRRVSAQAARSGRRGADPGLRRAKRVRPGLGSPDGPAAGCVIARAPGPTTGGGIARASTLRAGWRHRASLSAPAPPSTETKIPCFVSTL